MTETNQSVVGEQAVEEVSQAVAARGPMRLELPIEQAEALHQWLLTATNNGQTALDDPNLSAVLAKLGHDLDALRTVQAVRRELEEVGFDHSRLSDEQVAELGRRILEAHRPRPRAPRDGEASHH